MALIRLPVPLEALQSAASTRHDQPDGQRATAGRDDRVELVGDQRLGGLREYRGEVCELFRHRGGVGDQPVERDGGDQRGEHGQEGEEGHPAGQHRHVVRGGLLQRPPDHLPPAGRRDLHRCLGLLTGDGPAGGRHHQLLVGLALVEAAIDPASASGHGLPVLPPTTPARRASISPIRPARRRGSGVSGSGSPATVGGRAGGRPASPRPRWSRSVVPAYSVRNDAALLQQRHDRVGELVEPARGDVRDEDEAVAGVGLHEVVDRRRRPWPGVPMNDCRPVTSMISSRIDRFLASASSRHSRAVASGSRCIRTLARPRAMVFSPTTGSIVGQRAVRVVGRTGRGSTAARGT